MHGEKTKVAFDTNGIQTTNASTALGSSPAAWAFRVTVCKKVAEHQAPHVAPNEKDNRKNHVRENCSGAQESLQEEGAPPQGRHGIVGQVQPAGCRDDV